MLFRSQMVFLLQRLDPSNTIWHEVVMAETEKALAAAETLDATEKRVRRQRITDSFDQNVNQPDYARKLYLIENCIFGVDIQSIAVQIAKLRAFITLVCDQTPDHTNVAGNYNMLPLPNLETKFVAANSLIGLSTDFADGLQPVEGGSRLDDDKLMSLRAELAEVRHRHFRARTAHDKNTCRKLDRELRGRIKSRLVEIASKPDAEKIARFKKEIESLQRQCKAVEPEDWRDVLQTAPVQDDMFHPAPTAVQTMLHIDVNKEPRDKLDDDIRRLIRAIENEENRAKNKSAFQKEADRLAAWDPYDQNASSPFFDPQWMFGFKGGFDVVIGNPPYVQIQKLPDTAKNAYAAEGYQTFSRTSDLYCLFYERGGRFLNHTGSLCYITSNKFFRSGYGKPLRQLLTRDYSLRRLIDFGELPVFEAGTDPVITHFGKGPASCLTAATIKNVDDIQRISTAVTALGRTMRPDELSEDGWSLSGREAASILEKMRHNSTPLGKYVNGEIYYGIKTGFNDAFVIDSATRARLIAADAKSSVLIRPWLRGQDICRWYADCRDLYVIFTRQGTDIRDYPTIRKHLEKYRKQLEPKPKDWPDNKPWPGRKAGAYKWYEIQDNIAYHDSFEKPKIVYADIAKMMRASYDTEGLFCGNTMYIIPTENVWLLGYMNGHLFDWYARHNFQSLGDPWKGGRLRYIAQYMEKVPIPPATSAQQSAIATIVNRILDAKSTDPATDVSKQEAQIDRLIYELYGLTDDEIAIVEGREAGAKRTASVAKPVKASATRQPRKSVMTNDPDLS